MMTSHYVTNLKAAMLMGIGIELLIVGETEELVVQQKRLDLGCII
jgi:hypothetical protein